MRLRAAALLACFVGLLPPAVESVSAAFPDPANDPTHVRLSDLRPRTSAVKGDLGRPYKDGCHVARAVTRPTHCTYGRRDGTRVIVVVGDSIIAQWWAAIDRAARRAGWRVIWMTKSACPAADVTIRIDRTRFSQCDTWRRNVLTKVRGLSRVDMLLVSGSSHSTMLRRSDSRVITGTDAERAEWQAGYQRTVDRVIGQVRRVVIMRDTPLFPFLVPRCLVSHNGWTRSCSRARTSAFSTSHWPAEVAVDARHSWVRATDMADRMCQAALCWPVTSNRLLRYRDAHHITNTYSNAMAPAMYSRLRWLMM